MKKGIISSWNEERGFGFIAPESGGKQVFFHINNYSRNHKRPVNNLEIQYEISKDPKGRIHAIRVTPLKGHKGNNHLTGKLFSLIIFVSFFSALYYLLKNKQIPVILIIFYAAICILTFATYAEDKNSAKIGNWRVPEDTLHIFSLLGGWPGGKIAQSFLRHKSKKLSFQVIYWITVILNCSALYWLISPEGNLWLKKYIDF